MVLLNGQAAPDFKLFNTEKQLVTLSDFRDKNVLLLFFPLAFTRVCTAELCSVRDNIGFYNSLNAEIIGVSVDSLYTLGIFKKEQNLGFTLLSDFNKEVSAAYGALYKSYGYGMKGVSKRAAFILNKSGEIAYAEVLENDRDQPNFAAIEAVFGELN